jgi:WD40 repeat protein
MGAIHSIDICHVQDQDALLAMTGGSDRKVCVWNFAEYVLLKEFTGHSDSVNYVCCRSFDGLHAHFLSASDDHTVILWDYVLGVPKHQLSYHTDVVWVCKIETLPKLHAEPIIFSAGRDRSIVSWCSSVGEILRVYSGGHTAGVSNIAVVETRRPGMEPPLMASAGNDNLVVIWNLLSGEIFQTLNGHSKAVVGVCFYFPPGFGDPIVVSASMDKSIFLWEIKTKTIARRMACNQPLRSLAIMECKNGDVPLIFAADLFGTVYLFNLHTGKLQRSLQSDTGLRSLAVMDLEGLLGPIVATCGFQGKLNIFDLSSADILINISYAHPFELSVCAVHFYEEMGCVVATSCAGSSKIILWQNGGKRLHNLVNGHTDRITGLEFTRPVHKDEKLLLISISWDHTIIFWEVATGTIHKRLLGHDFRVRTLSYARSFNDTKQCLLTASMIRSKDSVNALCLWDVSTGELVHSETPSSRDAFTVYLFAPNRVLYPSSSVFATSDFIGIVACDNSNLFAIDFNTKARMMMAPMRAGMDIQMALTVFENSEKKEALLIGGGFATTITIWDLQSGNILRELRGHTDGVTTLTTMQSPNFMRGIPILVSGCADATVKLWDLETGETLQTRYGHSARIVHVCVRSTVRNSYFPCMCSFSADRRICIYDMSYGCSVLPSRGYVSQCYEADRLQRDGKWSRISRLSNTFGDFFWMENSVLILFSVWYKEIGFFVKFKDKIHLGVRSSRQSVGGLSFFEYIISYGSIILMKLLLSIWSKQLNDSIKDYADQHFFHQAYFIRVEDLLLLAKSFPAEFCEFICSLRLRPAHSSMNPRGYRYNMRDKEVIIGTCLQSLARDVWDKILDPEEAASGQPITVLFLPLIGGTDPRMLQAYVDVSTELKSVQLFNCDVGAISLRHVWRAYGKQMHLRSFVKYILFTTLYAVAVFSFDFCVQYSLASKVIAIVLQIATMLVVCHYIVEEWSQIKYENQSLFWHFAGDMWNTLDAVSLLGSLAGFICRLVTMSDSPVSRCILAVSSVTVWFKVLYYLRAFSSSGPLGNPSLEPHWVAPLTLSLMQCR